MMDASRWVFLSPHPDDAALCAGGWIYDLVAAGSTVEIWTLLAGVPAGNLLTPHAQVMHARWLTRSAEETIRVRREEDRFAARTLHAGLRHFDFLDAIYRTASDGSALYGDPVGAPMQAQDAGLIKDVAASVRAQLLPGQRVVTLLGIGNHVDHVLVRAAAEAAIRVDFYVADFPYVLRYPESVAPRTAGLATELQPISEAALDTWISAVMQYRSQLSAVFGDSDPSTLIRDYWAPDRSLRVWTPSTTA